MKAIIQYKFVIFFSFLILLVGCKNPGEKAYEDLLANGVTLSPNDTTVAAIGEQLFFIYKFSAGVQPIHYSLSYLNSDSTSIRYVDNVSFYLDDDDVDGGRSVGVHIFEGLKEGLVRLEFYNPYDNKEAYRHEFPKHWSSDRVIMEFYKVFSDSTVLNSWTEEDYRRFYKHWENADEEKKEAIWQALYTNWSNLKFPYDSLKLIKIMDRFAERYAIKRAAIQDQVLDSLFNMDPLKQLAQWKERLNTYRINMPLHKTLETAVCYIKIKH